MFNTGNFELAPKLIKAMNVASNADLYYKKLMDNANDRQEADLIMYFVEDTARHYKNFYNLYIKLTGLPPVLQQTDVPEFQSYVDGIDRAIINEVETNKFYRDIYLTESDVTAKKVFFEVLTDKNEHIGILNYLYARNICND